MEYFSCGPLLTKVVIFMLSLSGAFCCSGFQDGDFNAAATVRPKMQVHSTPGKVQIVDNIALIGGIGVEIRIDCWAPYPINFEFHGHLSNREVGVNLIRRTSQNHTDLSKYCFHINVTLLSYEQMTGNYSCFPVQNPAMQTSYYMYSAASPPDTILNRGQTIIVDAIPGHQWITIPCPSSNPNVTVYLFNENNEIITLSDQVQYDPKIGFSVKAAADSWGNFQCRTNLSRNDMVDVQVRPPRGFLVNPAEQLVILREGDVLKVSCESTEDILIQYDKSILMSQVRGRPRYEGRKLEYVLEFESGKLRAGNAGTVICMRKHDNQTLHKWIFQVREAKSGMMKNAEGMNSYKCASHKLTYFECSNWVECQMRKCTRKDRTCESFECNDAQTFNCRPSGILQCFNNQDESSQEIIYFTGLGRNNSYTEWLSAPREDILKIATFDFSIFRLKNEITTVKVVCEGSRFVFAVGFKWFLTTKGGNLIEIAENQIAHKLRSMKSKHIIKSTALINISSDVTTIICKAPVWNTTEWRNDVLDLTIGAENSRVSRSTKLRSYSLSGLAACVLLLLGYT